MTEHREQILLLEQDNIVGLPITHYNMEMAAVVRRAFLKVQPSCVAVEIAQPLEEQVLRGAERLPDISLVAFDKSQYLMIEPCDAFSEAVRSASEAGIPAHCIDLALDHYPDHFDPVPDPYAITRIGHLRFYEEYEKRALPENLTKSLLDKRRELYMARQLKELSLRYDKVLFVGGMYHVRDVMALVQKEQYEPLTHADVGEAVLITPSEESAREVMGECGWFTMAYELHRHDDTALLALDRHKLLFELYKQAGVEYQEEHRVDFPAYNLRNTMKFGRNYALATGRLVPTLFQLLTAAKGCVSHNYARNVWRVATAYPLRKNVDGLEERDLKVEDVWGDSKILRFHLTQRSRKERDFRSRLSKGRSDYKFEPMGGFTICSYPPEDVVVENFGDFLQKKGTQILTEAGAQSIPFTTSIEDGIDTRETIRHWAERQLYVKTRGRPPGGVGSVVVIFDPDNDRQNPRKYPWCTTWLGEHEQESDMALYATEMGKEVVGPGICRCTYGGFMMSYPPRRMFDVWQDADYIGCKDKSEVLLMAAIDYAVKPVVVYVAAEPPSVKLKQFARRYGKKVVYIPIGQLSPVTLSKIRRFHVLDSHARRDGADEFIE